MIKTLTIILTIITIGFAAIHAEEKARIKNSLNSENLFEIRVIKKNPQPLSYYLKNSSPKATATATAKINFKWVKISNKFAIFLFDYIYISLFLNLIFWIDTIRVMRYSRQQKSPH